LPSLFALLLGFSPLLGFCRASHFGQALGMAALLASTHYRAKH
jgi:hypothetical protein